MAGNCRRGRDSGRLARHLPRAPRRGGFSDGDRPPARPALPFGRRRRVLLLRDSQGPDAPDRRRLRRRHSPLFFHARAHARALAGHRESRPATCSPRCSASSTPFCSCSAVPLFIGFVTAGVPLGVTFSFLISAPMVNEVALVLLFGLFGWKVAALYLGIGPAVAIAAGWIIGRLQLERHVEMWVYELRARGPRTTAPLLSWRTASKPAGRRSRDRRQGLALCRRRHRGRRGHSRLCADELYGRASWARAHGGPCRSRCSSASRCIPMRPASFRSSRRSWARAPPSARVLAFMMSVVALSLPEMIILRKVLRPALIAFFAGVVTAGILLVGYLFNALL